jgi:hypothetical protein
MQAALAFDSELANSGLMPDLLLARAMLGDMASASEASIHKKHSQKALYIVTSYCKCIGTDFLKICA